jgi:hypothetical protein
MKSVLALAAALLAGLAALAPTPSSATKPATSVTVSFDEMGTWTGFYNMDPLFYEPSGVVFSDDYVVGFSNGHAVLDAGWTEPPTTIAGSFIKPISSITASIRMSMQGTSDYTIVAYSKSGDVLGSRTITLTQSGLDGNFYNLTADSLSPKATSFSITGGIAYAVQSITFAYR